MAKKRRKTAGAVGVSSATLYSAKKIKAGFTPYNVETSYRTPQEVLKKVKQPNKGYTNVGAIQRKSVTKSYSKYGVKTVATQTTTYSIPKTLDNTRIGARSTTLSGRGKLSKLGQIVIQERKAPESAGTSRTDFKGKTAGRYAQQGGTGTGAGRYKIDTITYAREGYPKPKVGRVPKGGRAAVSTFKQVGNARVYKDIVQSGSRVGKAIKASTAKDVLGLASKVGKGAASVLRAGNVAALGYEGARAIYKGYKRATGEGGKAFHGQFVDYTSKPTNRGKRGVNY